VQRLYQELTAVVHAPEMADFMAGFGYTPYTQHPAAFKAQLRDEATHWKPIVVELGIRLD
jgi:tripartite-type tricarboxylate transporter receptor subunit TctC